MGPEGRRRGSKPPIHALSVRLSFTSLPFQLFRQLLSFLPSSPSPFLPLLLLTTPALSLPLFPTSSRHSPSHSVNLSLSFPRVLPFLCFLSYFLCSLRLSFPLSLFLLSLFYLRARFVVLTTRILSFSPALLSFLFVQRRSMRAAKKDSFARLVGF